MLRGDAVEARLEAVERRQDEELALGPQPSDAESACSAPMCVNACLPEVASPRPTLAWRRHPPTLPRAPTDHVKEPLKPEPV